MKLGPLMIDIEGTILSPEDRDVIKHPLVGGIIFFARNYENPAQLKSLTEEIKTINPNILIAVDQEGGRIQRFKKGFSLLPSHGEIGELYNDDPEKGLKLAFDTGCLLARELIDLGVELSFAPVVDLNQRHTH